MTDGNRREMLLRVAFTLLIFAFLGKGVLGQCSTKPTNQAVDERAQNILMRCNRQTNVYWQITPTSDEMEAITLTNSDDTVDPSYTNIYGVNQTGLNIKEATTTPESNTISTSGLYVVKNSTNSTIKCGAKLLVVREGPTCTCNATNSTSLRLNCSIRYADSSYLPILAVMNWTSNGNNYTVNSPPRSRVDQLWFVQTSTITVNANVPAEFKCTLTFAKPTDVVQFPYIATNAPDYTASCIAPFCSGATTTTQPPTTTGLKLTTQPPTTTGPKPTSQPPTTIWPIFTTQPPTTPWTIYTPEHTTTACNCPSCPTCHPPEQNCTQAAECWSDGANLTEIYDACVVKAELYVKCEGCCQGGLICGVVVTLRNDSRWLIRDPLCDDGRCEMEAVDASCMSSDWKLLAEKKVITSGVADYVKAGSSVSVNTTDCSESCKRMMDLP